VSFRDALCEPGFNSPLPDNRSLQINRAIARNPQQPPSQSFLFHNPCGIACEAKECGLNRVFGVRLVAENPQTHTPHEFAMPPDDSGEGLIVTGLHEATE
jgi:hypothetical protein